MSGNFQNSSFLLCTWAPLHRVSSYPLFHTLSTCARPCGKLWIWLQALVASAEWSAVSWPSEVSALSAWPQFFPVFPAPALASLFLRQLRLGNSVRIPFSTRILFQNICPEVRFCNFYFHSQFHNKLLSFLNNSLAFRSGTQGRTYLFNQYFSTVV